jgi:type II secretory pathway component PulF
MSWLFCWMVMPVLLQFFHRCDVAQCAMQTAVVVEIGVPLEDCLRLAKGRELIAANDFGECKLFCVNEFEE